MSVFQGDFLGFQLGDEHSYNLNITRVSTNDRYQDNLLPMFTDAVVQVPGGDGTYYWDTYYTQKQFQIDFAFDDLRDEDLRKLRQMFSVKKVQPLIFDEFPYKYYMVKCAQPPQLKYICFDKYEFRIYKGEGTVSLIAYYPFAFSVVSPSLEWNQQGAIINNTGDLPANLQIIYDLNQVTDDIILTLVQQDIQGIDNTIGYLKLKDIEPQGADKYIMIDTQTQLIEGLNASKIKTNHLYNLHIDSGDFFFPPINRSILQSNVPFVTSQYTPLYY